MIGVDCATGKIVWQTPNPDSLQMSHCSIIPMEIAGKRMYVYNALGGVAGVSAEAEDLGKLLWVTTDWKPAVVAASTLYIGNNEIAVFGSYGAGGAKIRVTREAGGFSASVSQKHLASEGIASDQQTPILSNGYLWSVMPENAGILKKQLVCYSTSDLLKPVWTSGKENRYGRGLGPYILSGDKLFLLDDDCKLYYFRISSQGAELVTSHKIMDGIEAWGPMAIASRYLLLRDSRNMLCLDIGVK
jgi:outer membrane protein assembly factor BamB